MEEKMTIEEWVQRDREEKRKLFGEVGLHDNCQNFKMLHGMPFCNACNYWSDNNKYGRNQQILECEKNMCYFYEPKRKDGEE